MGRGILVILLILMGSILTGFSQSPTIQIVDEQSGQSIPFAHICFESLDKNELTYKVSSEKGTLPNEVNKVSQVAISFMGFATLIDTVEPGKSYTFYMEPSSYDVDEIVVTGQYIPQKADQSIYDVKVIGKNQIEGKAANNLSDLLTNELNMRTSMDGVLGSNISIQGLTGEHVKILVDGVPVIGRMNGNIDLSQLNMQNVDHVEIVEGPMSVIYGSNALAGAINIITKQDLRKKLHTDVNAYYESVGIYNLHAASQFRIQDHTFQLGIARDFFGGYSENDQGRVKKLKPKLQYSGNLDYTWQLKDGTIRYSSEYFNEELRNKGPLLEDFFYKKAFDEYHYTHRFNNKVFLSYKLNEQVFLDGIVAYSMYDKIKNTTLNDLVNLNEELVPDTSRHDTTSFDVMLFRGTWAHLISNRLEYQLGYDVNLETGTGKRISDQKRIDDYAGFLSFKYRPFKNLSFQPGVRFMYNTKYDAPLVYSLNLLWKPIPELDTRFSYGKGFRAPSLKELYLDFVDINHNIHGNPDLEAEYADNFNLSVAYAWDFGQRNSLKFENKYFYNIIENKIDYLYYENDPTRADMTNIKEGDYKSIGAQVKLTYSLHPRLTYSLGLNHTGNSTFSDLNKYSYFTDFSSSFNYKNLKYQFRINIYYKYTDKIRRYLLSIDDQGNREVNESYVNDYHILDCTVSYPFFNNQLLVSAGLKNIFDNTSVLAAGSGGAHSGTGDGSSLVDYGRTFFIKINYNFNRF